MSPLHGFFDIGMIVRVGTFIECHDDVGAEIFLNGNRLLWCEAVCRPIDVTFEGHAILVDLAGLCQREDLKAARVGQHGTMPLHELVQTAHVAHEFVAGAQIEMISVAQDERSIDILEMLGRERLDRRLCAHGRKDRRNKIAVRGIEDPRAGTVVSGGDLELEHWGELYKRNTADGFLILFLLGGYESGKIQSIE